MLNKLRVTQAIAEAGVVAVLRADSAEEVARMARHAIRGGIKAIEITMTVPMALQAIQQLAAEYSSKADPASDAYAIIGVGTVLDPETARAAILSGAEFVVAPAVNPDTITLCNRYAVPVMPGTMTIRDIQTAMELGADIVKLFPGSAFGPDMITAVKGPLPQANIMPTGGVSLANLALWVKAGAVAVGIGGDLTKEAVKQGDYTLIERQAQAYVQAYRDAKA
ncbi:MULTISPECIES: bifunctional 2-keto-4-hydroxyglutarate aldolase/2-keto-3-deoxy-6-phosphogluconate aldolase [unclassified Paenibacillus]|uniref:bifunctional 2-keto-4-hydroxyglutarate aldolase/2-keto-3-deoxy-6-phosphogluconate aldolase n=1 Tax=unclassified Paenibacillus TaxID=185978 RepID=UPI000956D9FF|nr:MULTISPECIES: bifunctional 2-keto-4-hydroxyglutarate aldolase/2-keto-3-deoxy-6-phosphogluconate aldolase [unclassified Paenibacillus]ASS67134.1 bifunctional 4-hydroxy-2-oxoglutarate aldolase/2-dehydro-3-deoxy-phosphogluconate aldolase [Paenibacillus sp. RUD330]SIQ88875.1 2-dehydro-3-deoxyphosphogluconate aldolase / (4S)-4-hydroxy-2-oxoglutarate aldolase [Paenibacillus sp. RU4X]SIR09814.1 2-dehydro-3-deoxyphosphogluconate aldolase / (4S)-4-hydroxy-2-oxoglutarate aldolase [Paenibacillus sp. RU4